MDNYTTAPTPCRIEDCERPARKVRLCDAHYWRQRKHGDPHHGGPIKTAHRDPEAAFAERTQRRGSCLIWTGSKNDRGYGKLTVNGRLTYSHVYAWERVNGPIPEGMDIDHRYRCDRLCCEVSHLRLASRSQNLWNRVGPIPGRIEDLPRNVYLDRKSGSYFVKITRNGERHHIGTFATVEEADAAAENARKDLHGAYYAPA